jgi:nuclear transport factor 2 (NTF2) superfamily protein
MKERENEESEFREEMSAFLDREWTDEDAVRISKELRKQLSEGEIQDVSTS